MLMHNVRRLLLATLALNQAQPQVMLAGKLIVMLALFTNITAIILYIIAGIYCLIALRENTSDQKEEKQFARTESPLETKVFVLQPNLLKLIALAIAVHGIGAYSVIVKPEGLALGFFKISSLIAWCINLIVLISGLRKPLDNLWLFLLPISIIAVTISLLGHSPFWQQITLGVSTHILFSILAYSLFTIAFLQAMLLTWQNYQLKNHLTTARVILFMPPLETMETLLFEIIWVGQIFLTIGIVIGIIYIDDIFAQHLAHKTVLSLLAWLVFAGLLWGKYWIGWRGNTSIRWIVTGFFLLMLAFYGSKLVLEILLQR